MSILIRELDDQTQSGSMPQLNLFTGGSAERYQLVKELVFRITVTATVTTAGNWATTEWLRQSFLKNYYRIGGNNNAVVHVDNVSLQQLGCLATSVYDGTLDTDDGELPRTVAFPTVAGGQTAVFTLRVPLTIPTLLQTGDDLSIQLAEIGQQSFSFGPYASAASTAAFTINNIRVQAYAKARPTRSLRVGVYSRIESQICKSPQSKDVISVGANEKVAYLQLVSTDPTQSVALATYPIVSQAGKPIIEGNRLDNVQFINKIRGEAFYPQSSSIQTTNAPTEWVELLVPDYSCKTSELVGNEALNIDFTQNTITAGRAFYTVFKALGLDAAQAAIRAGRDLEAATRAVSNAGKPYGSDSMLYVPIEF